MKRTEEKLNQETKVIRRILDVGYVDNFWAIENYILRLGAIMYGLRKQGVKYKSAFGKQLGKPRKMWRNYYYY